MIDLISFTAVCIICFLVWLVGTFFLANSALREERDQLEEQLEQRDNDYWQLRECMGENAYVQMLKTKAIKE